MRGNGSLVLGERVNEVICVLPGLVRDMWPMQFGTSPTANPRRYACLPGLVDVPLQGGMGIMSSHLQ